MLYDVCIQTAFLSATLCCLIYVAIVPILLSRCSKFIMVKIKVASLVIESGRMLTIGVRSVVDIKNGTEETVVCFIMFFGVY
jgi:hypothetical protein